MQKGADAILIEQLDMTEAGSPAVAHKTREQHKRRTSSSRAISTTSIERNRFITAKLLKYR
jgi:hypothetical protein